MFEDKRYHVTGPTGGPGVLGPWHPVGAKAKTRHSLQQTGSPIWHRIIGRARAA